MTTLENLKSKILILIKDNNYDIEDLKSALDPVGDYITNPIFKNNIVSVVDIITKDRDGNNKFTIEDMKLIGNDFQAISGLVSAILLIVTAIPTIKFQYEAGATEELIFKLLSYIFLVVVPKQTGSPLSYDDKVAILDVVMSIYGFIKASQFTKDLVAKIVSWFKSKGMCNCTSKAEVNDAIVESKMPKIKMELTGAMNNVRDKSAMMDEIKSLKKQIKKNKN